MQFHSYDQPYKQTRVMRHIDKVVLYRVMSVSYRAGVWVIVYNDVSVEFPDFCQLLTNSDILLMLIINNNVGIFRQAEILTLELFLKLFKGKLLPILSIFR